MAGHVWAGASPLGWSGDGFPVWFKRSGLKKDGVMVWLGTPDLKCSTIFSPALTSWTIETYAGYTGICWHIHSWHAQWQTKWSIFHSAFPWVLLHAEAWQGPFHYHRRQNQVGTVCRRILIGLFGLTLRTKNSDTVTMCFLFFCQNAFVTPNTRGISGATFPLAQFREILADDFDDFRPLQMNGRGNQAPKWPYIHLLFQAVYDTTILPCSSH